MRRFLLACATLVFSTVALAETPPVPLLWKVSDKDNSVYLLGSFHMLRQSDWPLSKDVDAAFADAEEVVFELPPDEMLSTEVGRKMIAAGQRDRGSLDDDLTPALKLQLDKWLGDNSMPPTTFATYKPWFASLMVTIMEARRAGFDSTLGLDARLGQRAKEGGKRTAGFETGMAQVDLFDQMSSLEQTQMLAEALDTEKNGASAIERMHAQWRAGDVDALWKTLGVEFRQEYPALYKKINADRNAAWVPQIRKRLDGPNKDDTLVVVGALHLLGADGVVERLKAQGYKVERVCSACKAH